MADESKLLLEFRIEMLRQPTTTVSVSCMHASVCMLASVSMALAQVFDIDETVLSNAAEWLDPQPVAGGNVSAASSRFARGANYSSSSSSKPGRLLSGKDVKDRAQNKFDR